jgi:hypothetical protein
VQVEATHLNDYRPNGSWAWYAHSDGVDATNAGQLLGAMTGPGGDSQRLVVDLLTASGRMGGFVQRTARNEQYFWNVIYPQPDRAWGHDAELAAGYRQVLFLAGAEVSLELSAARRWNRDFLKDETNLRAAVQVGWPVSAPSP